MGIVILFVSFLGIPNSWKMVIAIVIGVLLIASAIRLREDYRLLRRKIRTQE